MSNAGQWIHIVLEKGDIVLWSSDDVNSAFYVVRLQRAWKRSYGSQVTYDHKNPIRTMQLQPLHFVSVWGQARPYLGHWQSPPSYESQPAIRGWIDGILVLGRLSVASSHKWAPNRCGSFVVQNARIELDRCVKLDRRGVYFGQSDKEYLQEKQRKAVECNDGLKDCIDNANAMAWLREGYGSGSSSEEEEERDARPWRPEHYFLGNGAQQSSSAQRR